MNPKLCFLCGSSHHLFIREVMHNLQPSFGGCCTQSEQQGMKGKDRKQPWLSARISWENILQPSSSYSSSSSSSSSFTAAVRRGGSEQLHTKRREGGWECYRDGSGPPWHETDCTASYKQGIWYPTNMVTKHIFHLSQQNACVDVIKQVKSNKTRVSSPKMTLINEWRHLKILNRPDIIQLVYIEIHVMVLHNQN